MQEGERKLTADKELTRTELRRVADEFKSERDAAKESAMRAYDERNILLAQLGKSEMSGSYKRCSSGHIDLWYDTSDGEECPLCEVIKRGWGKPVRK